MTDRAIPSGLPGEMSAGGGARGIDVLRPGTPGATIAGYPASAIADAARHFEACHPREGCGAIVRMPDGGMEFRPIPNVAQGPDSFELDPVGQLDLWAAQDRGEHVIVAIAHSHCEVSAALSERDREGARLWPGGPLAAGPLDWLVVEVRTRGGRPKAQEVRVFPWAEGALVDAAATGCLSASPDR